MTKMQIFEVVMACAGSLAWGVAVAYITRMFVWRFKEHDPKALAKTMGVLGGGVLAGGAAVGFAMKMFLSDYPIAFFFYPIGIVVGFVWYHRVASKHKTYVAETVLADQSNVIGDTDHEALQRAVNEELRRRMAENPPDATMGDFG